MCLSAGLQVGGRFPESSGPVRSRVAGFKVSFLAVLPCFRPACFCRRDDFRRRRCCRDPACIAGNGKTESHLLFCRCFSPAKGRRKERKAGCCGAGCPETLCGKGYCGGCLTQTDFGRERRGGFRVETDRALAGQDGFSCRFRGWRGDFPGPGQPETGTFQERDERCIR